MEYFDIYDESGKSLNEALPRAQVHKEGHWHKAVDIWVITTDDELVIQRRAEDKESYPGLLEISASGHISSGEDSATAAARELEEELGIKADPSDFELLFKVTERHVTNNGKFLNNEFKDVYLLKRKVPKKEIKFLEEEISGLEFFPLPDLKKMVTENLGKFVPHEEAYNKSFAILAKKI